MATRRAPSALSNPPGLLVCVSFALGFDRWRVLDSSSCTLIRPIVDAMSCIEGADETGCLLSFALAFACNFGFRKAGDLTLQDD